MSNERPNQKGLIPRVEQSTIDAFTRFGSLETRGDEVYSMFRDIERENPELFEYVSQQASAILKREPIAGMYIGKGFTQGVVLVYHLLRKQAEADRKGE